MDHWGKLWIIGSLLLLVFTACEQRPIDEEVIADWRFVSIKDTAGTDVRQIGPEDLMRIRKDKTFTYQLALEDIAARGEWRIEGDYLIYAYDQDNNGKPDYERRYKIKDLSDTTLILEEEGVDYRFRKETE